MFWITAHADGDIARPMTYHSLWHRVKQIEKWLRAEGMIRNSLEITPHLFRQSYITNLYRAGMIIKALQKKNRHRNMEILISHCLDDSEAAAPYLDKILSLRQLLSIIPEGKWYKGEWMDHESR